MEEFIKLLMQLSVEQRNELKQIILDMLNAYQKKIMVFAA